MANSRAVRNVTQARHVAIIMDGNGRWATQRGMPRLFGHKRGVDAVRSAVKACPDLGVTHLTLFAFSTENWKRSAEEVSGLMRLLRLFIQKEVVSLVSNGVRLRFIGRRDRFSNNLRALMAMAEAQTEQGAAMNLTIALDYGGRDEMTRAVKKIAKRVAAGELTPEQIDEDLITAHLDTADLPEPDLVIRTSGECRTSNFLLWQAAYSEYDFVALNWPDFNPEAFKASLDNFLARDRRFGAVSK